MYRPEVSTSPKCMIFRGYGFCLNLPTQFEILFLSF
jgi:hypothetical protein